MQETPAHGKSSMEDVCILRRSGGYCSNFTPKYLLLMQYIDSCLCLVILDTAVYSLYSQNIKVVFSTSWLPLHLVLNI